MIVMMMLMRIRSIHITLMITKKKNDSENDVNIERVSSSHIEQAGMSSAQPQAEAVSLKFWVVYV